ncbi:transferrin-like protein [Leptotrombidium deliense]|uniref:Transferrin-like protein n=1 Tax=Leptotrombidium deliense TaxID=299467 RepID=A0A443S127_9ACAR|nr:transferrin-like protein [Leptotrombidium deliense]
MNLRSSVALFLIYLNCAFAVYFEISETERKCFIERIPGQTLVIGRCKIELNDVNTRGYIQKSSAFEMFVEVRDPYDKTILSKVYGAEGRFSFTSQTPGEHAICLYSNSTRWFAGAKLLGHLDIQVGEYGIDYSVFAQNEETMKFPARLCVVSQKEFEKCNSMRNAFASKRLKPDLSCVVEHSSINCMKAIKDGFADLAVLDAGDIYKAGQSYNLMPIVAEQYDLKEPSYYVIAIAKQSDKDTDLLYLKGKRSCHTGINKAAGWVMPMSFLLTNNRIRPYGCDSSKAASEFFQKSCVPGVLSILYGGTSSWSFANLCDLCHGTSSHFCSRSAAEPFYGDTGALRCLVEGGGQIAFAKHTTILENTGQRNPSWWSRNLIPDDFELLCRDGSRAKFNEFERCNLGKVAANAIVTSKDRKKEFVDAYVNLFLIAQQLYGSKYSSDFTFKMFTSEDEVHDLIFQDATSQLKAIPEHRRNYEIYLGHEFLKSMKVVDCTAAAASVKPLIFISTLLIVIRLLL